jgi:hypothetical protein
MKYAGSPCGRPCWKTKQPTYSFEAGSSERDPAFQPLKELIISEF